MRHNKVFRILALAVILSLLMLAIPATPALAVTPTITPSAYTGPVGTAITVSGEGFAVSVSGYVWFDTDGDSIIDAGEPQATATTNASGVLSAASTLTVPTVPRATYSVRADVPSGSSIEAYASFTVTPQITLSASTGNVGDTVTVTGNGFAATAGITILYDDVSKGTTTTTATGAFTSFSLTVPDSIKGSHTVKARETSATTNYDDATYTVSPEITLDPASGAVGDEVTVTGTGFADDSDILIFFDGDEVDITGDDQTDEDGSFESTFDVPGASRGSHTITAEDEVPNSAPATFTVGQKITIDPDSGSSGTTVTVTGTGFRASYNITVYYNEVDITDDITGDDKTDSDGSFEFTFAVPAGSTGTYEVEVSDGSYTATADFEFTTDATISQTTTAAAPGYVGMELTITGTGFLPDTTVTITYATTPVTLATPTTDGSGNFTAPITIPASVGGAHIITVTDDTTSFTKSFTFYMESAAPPVPSLVLPAAGTKLEELGFDWTDVTDLSGVTYDFQVSTDSSFSTKLLDKTGLTASAYTLLEAEKLDSTSKDEPYYWHVRAVDAASNASPWSSAGTFTVGIGLAWLPYILMVVIAIVFFVFGVWVGKRSGGY